MHLRPTSSTTDVHVHIPYRHTATAPQSTVLTWSPPYSSLGRIVVLSRPGSAAPPPSLATVKGGGDQLSTRWPFPIELSRARSIVEDPSPCPGNEAALEANLLGRAFSLLNSVALWSDVLRMADCGSSGWSCLPARRPACSRSEIHHGLVIIWGGVEPCKIGCKLLLCTWFDRSERGDRFFFCLFV
jgi:hypothetical protein